VLVIDLLEPEFVGRIYKAASISTKAEKAKAGCKIFAVTQKSL
jgi:hypothetical protein